MSFRDVDLVRGIYAAMAEKDFPSVFAVLDQRFVLTQDPLLPWGGWYEGHHGFATFGIKLGECIESTVTTAAFFEANGEVIQYGRTKGSVLANGAPFDIPEVHRWTIRDGVAVLAHFAIDTPAMLRALSA